MLSHAERMKLKAATHLLVREAGGQEACAMASERITRHQSFSEYSDRKRPDRFIAIDTVAEIERFASMPIVTRMLAELSGHVLLPMPQIADGLCRIDMLTAKAISQFGQMLTDLAEARADGEISTDEARQLKPAIDDLVSKLVKLRHEISARAENEEAS